MGKNILIAVFAAVWLSACGGNDGKDGKDGETTVVGVLSADTVSTLEVEIESVDINSAPVVTFRATDGNGIAVAGLTTSNVRFNIAKLTVSSEGLTAWQNYINSLSSGELQATTESNGSLEDLGNGRYTYTFATDITDASKTVGNIAYNPSLTHRVAMQISGFPATNPTFDFRPDGGTVTTKREIVKTESCNSCHNQLALHGGGRIEMKYCVTCHNPGSTDPDSGNTVDFKVMVHKIHMGEELPSVAYGPDLLDGTADDGTGVYQIIGFRNSVHDYSTVVFPQDIRNCTKCHDGGDSATPQGDNWKSELSMEACGSCHDNIDFSKDGSPDGDADPLGHPGGSVNNNSECVTCHAANRVAGSVESKHKVVINDLVSKFEFNILEVCGDEVATAEPDCSGAPVTPTVTFSVTDPSNGDAPYDVVNDPEFGAGASLNILTAWDSSDYSNDGGAGSRPSRANSFSLSSIKACVAAAVVCSDNGDGSFTVQVDAMPAGVTDGSGAVALEGHPRGESDPGSGNFDTSVPVSGTVAYFGINGDTLVERRVAVDIASKCDNCHGILSLHGANRAENAQLCVMCHNPRGTDIDRRDITTPGIPDVSPLDGKKEETIDFKVLIHAIHAGERDNPATAEVEGHGIRENGIVVYGFGNNPNDYGHVRFPGFLNDCTTCHNSGTYELDGTWETPLQNGILATTVQSAPTATTAGEYTTETADQTDDLYTTPTAAVCSACHDGDLAKEHMQFLGGALFGVDQAAIGASYETCAVCHGPGTIADLNVVHDIE